jgi:hypothetical protein
MSMLDFKWRGHHKHDATPSAERRLAARPERPVDRLGGEGDHI